MDGGSSSHATFAANQAELAWLFGVSVSTVRLWAAEGAPPKEPRGYALQAWVKWRLARQVAQGKRPEGATAADADRRFKLARAAREEIRLRRDQGLVVDADGARDKRERIIRWFLAQLEQLGPQLQATLTSQIGLKSARATRKAAEDYVLQLRRSAASGS